MVSPKTVGRMSLYRRLLISLREAGAHHVFSHQLARLAVVTAAQVRRDLMAIGYSGSPTRGYEIQECLESIGGFLDAPEPQEAVLVGMGRLGRAILAYFSDRRPNLSVVAAFDIDPAKVGTLPPGIPCLPMSRLAELVEGRAIRMGIITVPAPAAQSVAHALVTAGVRGIVNFAPVRLNLPEEIYVEEMDITASLERAAFFARQGSQTKGGELDSPAESELRPLLKELERLLSRSKMKMEELARRIGARVITPGRSAQALVLKVYAGDRVSDLLDQASSHTLMVTNLESLQLIRVAELMDIPGICFVNGNEPDTEMLEAAQSHGTLVMVSPVGVFETCGRMFQALEEDKRVRA